jgi:hypothetical protein
MKLHQQIYFWYYGELLYGSFEAGGVELMMQGMKGEL